MGNWAKGLAAGLETGYRMGEMYQKGAERRALQEAATATPEQFQGYTTEQGAQLEAAAKSGLYDIGMKTDEAGNFQGYTVTPKASPEMQGLVAPGQVSEMYGQRYAGTLAPEQVQGLRMGRMADVVAETDPIRAQQLRAQQAEQEFQAKYRPMQLESAGLALSKGKREEAAAGRMQEFQTWQSENPNASFADIVGKTKALGMNLSEQKEAASSVTGIAKAQFDNAELELKNLVKGKNLDQLLTAHRTSDLLDPGSHFEKRLGAGGKVSLDRVDTASGKVIQSGVFSGNENEVLGFLHKAAVSPEAIVDYTMNLEKNRVAIEKDSQLTEQSRAYTGFIRNRSTAEKPTAVASLVDQAKGLVKDGTYKDVPTAIEALKKGSVRDRDQEAWAKAENELMKGGSTGDEILLQRDQFFARRGYAPALLQQVVSSGIDPTTNKPLTMKQVEDFNRKYPQSAIDVTSLPWVQREQTRQGLINQIPR
jgi:hypothetical protein